MKSETKPPQSLFKYVGASGVRILQTNTLKFTRPSLLNDPFEVRPFLKTIGGELDWAEQFKSQLPATLDKEFDKLPEQLRRVLSRETLLDQLNTQKPLALEMMRQALKQLTPTMNAEFYRQADAMIGILSLTENQNHLLMWSHYADFHRGMVLEFDSTNEFFNRRRSINDEFYHLRQVVYSRRRPHVDLLRTDCLELFLTKSQDWEYEAEWRMMLPIKDCQEVSTAVHVQGFPSECLKAVIFGANSSSDLRAEVRNTIQSNASFSHVRVLFAKLHMHEYTLEFSEVE